VVKRAAKSFANLYEKLAESEKEKTTFDAFVKRVVTVARGLADERAAKQARQA
jgi:hypothetical protein